MSHHHRISPAPSPHPIITTTPSPQPTPPSYTTSSSSSDLQPPPSTSSQSKLPIDLSPPLIAMIIIIATAFVIITYSRFISRHLTRSYRRYARWRRRRRRPPSSAAASTPPYPFDHADAAAFHVLSPYGLDESIIKTIPLSIYGAVRKSTGAHSFRDCAVCLLEFEDNDYVRSLPVCNHEFHVECIDIWLRSHANCPLCRAGIFNNGDDSPFTPLMAARIRPSLEDVMIDNITVLEPLTEISMEYSDDDEMIIEDEEDGESNEITLIQSPRRSSTNNVVNHSQLLGTQSEDRYNRRDFLLTRSYSFSFERSLGSERSLVLEQPATASPWRFRRGIGGSGAGGSFWSKRLSPFSSLSKPRVFSFRYGRGMKYSPFLFRRQRRNSVGSFLPLSESSVRLGSSRRTKSSLASPMFVSRLRSGDPEALLSPERLNRR